MTIEPLVSVDLPYTHMYIYVHTDALMLSSVVHVVSVYVNTLTHCMYMYMPTIPSSLVLKARHLVGSVFFLQFS